MDDRARSGLFIVTSAFRAPTAVKQGQSSSILFVGCRAYGHGSNASTLIRLACTVPQMD